jgi:signal peptidase I
VSDTTQSDPQTASAGRRLLHALVGPLSWRNLFSWAFFIGALFFVKGCVVDQYAVPTGSMEPTIHGDPRFFRGDRVLVNKWEFGPRIPFTTHRLWKWGGPKRWDIVVFYAPEGAGTQKILVKRVIGLPGEKVQIRDGKITINGDVVEPPAELRDILHYTTQFSIDPVDVKRNFLDLARKNLPLFVLNPNQPDVKQLYQDMAAWRPKLEEVAIPNLNPDEVNRLCEGVSPVSIKVVEQLIQLNLPPLRYGVWDDPAFSLVPSDHYLMMGDNSGQSRDGREWGFVSSDHLLGRAFAIWWPLPRRRDFSGFSHTWWGRLLLYGIPALIVLHEIYHSRRERKRKKSRQ